MLLHDERQRAGRRRIAVGQLARRLGRAREIALLGVLLQRPGAGGLAEHEAIQAAVVSSRRVITCAGLLPLLARTWKEWSAS